MQIILSTWFLYFLNKTPQRPKISSHSKVCSRAHLQGRMSQTLPEGKGGRGRGKEGGRDREPERESEQPTLTLISSELPCPRLLAPGTGRVLPGPGHFVSSGPGPRSPRGRPCPPPGLPTGRVPPVEEKWWHPGHSSRQPCCWPVLGLRRSTGGMQGRASLCGPAPRPPSGL